MLDPAMKAAGASSAPQQGATPAAPATPTAATGRGRSAAARNPRDWAALYQALAAACAALALACLLAPRLVGCLRRLPAPSAPSCQPPAP